MTADADVRNLLKIFTHDAEPDQIKMGKLIRAGVDEIKPFDSDIYARMKKGPEADEKTIWWYEQPVYQMDFTARLTDTTLQLSGSLFQKAITADAMKQHIMVDLIIRRQSDGVQARVTAVDYDNLRCTIAAHSDYSLTNDSGAVTWERIAMATWNYNETHQPQSLDVNPRFCGTQILEATWQHDKDFETTRFEDVVDKVEAQYRKVCDDLRRQIARAILLTAPMVVGGQFVTGRATAKSTVTGLIHWPRIVQAEAGNAAVYVDKGGKPLTIPDLDKIVEAGAETEKCDYGSGDWVMCFHPMHLLHIGNLMVHFKRATMKETKAGWYVDGYVSKEGKSFGFLTDRNFPRDLLFIVDISRQEWCWYKGQQIAVKELPTQGNFVKRLISCQVGGVVSRIPRQILSFRGLPTSY